MNTLNMDRAIAGWGADLPEWVKLLAQQCDRTSQRTVADKLGKSSGYVSRLINCNYAGSYSEAETQVRALFGQDQVDCPLWGEIPLASCVRARRRKEPPRTHVHHLHRSTCPSCPNNTDLEHEED